MILQAYFSTSGLSLNKLAGNWLKGIYRIKNKKRIFINTITKKEENVMKFSKK